MAIASKSYDTLILSSEYYAYTMNKNGVAVYRTSTPTVVNSAVFPCSFADFGIPSGSTIISAIFSFDSVYPAHGFTQRKLMHSYIELDTWFTPGDTIDINSYATFFIRFQGGKDGTSYPEKPLVIGDEAAKKNIGVWKLENLKLTVEYSPSNVPPVTPEINYPAAGDIGSITNPAFKVTVAAEPDGQAQKLQAKLNAGGWIDAKTGIPASGGVYWAKPFTMGIGQHTVYFRVVDSMGAVSGEASRTVAVAASPYARAIAAGTPIWDETYSHQAEIEQLYDMTNALRTRYGLAEIDKPLKVGANHASPGAGKIGMFAAWGSQMAALQAAIGQVYALWDEAISWIAAESGCYPSAEIFNQIRERLAG